MRAPVSLDVLWVASVTSTLSAVRLSMFDVPETSKLYEVAVVPTARWDVANTLSP